MTYSEQLRNDIDAAAEKLGMTPYTLGGKLDQGGQFYARLAAGKRVFPETADNARKIMAEMLKREGHAA